MTSQKEIDAAKARKKKTADEKKRQQLLARQGVIREKAEHLLQVIEELLADAETWESDEADCPIVQNHFRLSEILAGSGRAHWYCPFCGKRLN